MTETYSLAVLAGFFAIILIFCLWLDWQDHFSNFTRTVGILSASLAFAIAVGWLKGTAAASLFVTGYLLEEALSVDNLFVFWVIFKRFKVPTSAQKHILQLGIGGAIVLRLSFIALSGMLLHRFDWLFIPFGILLILAGASLIRPKTQQPDQAGPSLIALFLARFVPLSSQAIFDRWWVYENRCWRLTPLFVIICVIEGADLIFALDSVPAIFGITNDLTIIATSNICAILGLRSLYFVLQDMVNRFAYLPQGLSVILMGLGFKMIFFTHTHFPEWWVPLLIVLILISTVVLSFIFAQKSPSDTQAP